MSKEFENVICNLQSARDRLMPKVETYFGDAFDGDFDSMLDAINTMKRYQQNIDKDRAIFREQGEQRAALLEALVRCERVLCRTTEEGAYSHALECARAAIALAQGDAA